jgi:hypothetical protein
VNTFNGAVVFGSTVTFNLGAQTFVTPKFTPPIVINTANAYTWSFANPAAPRTINWNDPVDAAASVAYGVGTFTNGNLRSSNANGNSIDSGIAASNVVTLAGTQTLTNKTLTSPSISSPTITGGESVSGTSNHNGSAVTNSVLNGASSGNAVTLLNYQSSKAAITGNAADQALYSFALPANVVATGKGIRVVCGFSHSSGTATVSYKVKVNGVALGTFNSAATLGGIITDVIMAGSSTSADFIGQAQINTTVSNSVSTASTTGLAWTSSQTVEVDFNVAATTRLHRGVLWSS